MARALAHQALAAGHRRQARDLAAAALTRAAGHVDGATEALLHVTYTRALAALGEKPAAARALLAAEDVLARGGQPQAGYSLLAGPAAGTFASYTARALTEAADHAAAEARHRAVFPSWDPDAFPRVHLLTWTDLGDCLAAAGPCRRSCGRMGEGTRHGRRDGVRTQPGCPGIGLRTTRRLPAQGRAWCVRAGAADAARGCLVTQSAG